MVTRRIITITMMIVLSPAKPENWGKTLTV
jgi:hypothetical protein